MGQVVIESVDSLEETDTKNPEDEMVVHQNITTDRFLPYEWPHVQQQAPFLPDPHGRKRPQNTSDPTDWPNDAPTRMPPAPTSVPLTIRELTLGPCPSAKVGLNIVSSLAQLVSGW